MTKYDVTFKFDIRGKTATVVLHDIFGVPPGTEDNSPRKHIAEYRVKIHAAIAIKNMVRNAILDMPKWEEDTKGVIRKLLTCMTFLETPLIPYITDLQPLDITTEQAKQWVNAMFKKPGEVKKVYDVYDKIEQILHDEFNGSSDAAQIENAHERIKAALSEAMF